MDNISLSKFLDLYEAGILHEVVNVKNYIYGRTNWGGTDRIVRAEVP